MFGASTAAGFEVGVLDRKIRRDRGLDVSKVGSPDGGMETISIT
jgi:hypothetical protein